MDIVVRANKDIFEEVKDMCRALEELMADKIEEKVKEGVKVVDVFDILRVSLVLDAIRYMLVVIVGFGLCPILFKKCNL